MALDRLAFVDIAPRSGPNCPKHRAPGPLRINVSPIRTRSNQAWPSRFMATPRSSTPDHERPSDGRHQRKPSTSIYNRSNEQVLLPPVEPVVAEGGVRARHPSNSAGLGPGEAVTPSREHLGWNGPQYSPLLAARLLVRRGVIVAFAASNRWTGCSSAQNARRSEVVPWLPRAACRVVDTFVRGEFHSGVGTEMARGRVPSCLDPTGTGA